MIVRKKSYSIGDRVILNSSVGGYQLPVEVLEGSEGVVMDRGVDVDVVRVEGVSYSISKACVFSGEEVYLRGRWRDETDPLVRKMSRERKLHMRCFNK